MNIFVWLAIGAVVGWIASFVMPRSKRETMKTLLNVVAGAGGSLLAGMMVSLLGTALGTTSSAAQLGELLACTGTAIILLTVIAELRHRGRNYHRLLPDSSDVVPQLTLRLFP